MRFFRKRPVECWTGLFCCALVLCYANSSRHFILWWTTDESLSMTGVEDEPLASVCPSLPQKGKEDGGVVVKYNPTTC